MKIYCLGDSLTFGFGVKPSSRWANLVAAETGIEMINRGISGDTAVGMLSRLGGIISEIKEAHGEPQLVFVMGGYNDYFYSGSFDTARSSIGAIIHQLLSSGIDVLAGIPAQISSADIPENWSSLIDYRAGSAETDEYCSWLENYCRAFAVPFIDFRPCLQDSSGKLNEDLLLDGLHPNTRGHRLMADRFIQSLKEINIL